MVKKAPGKAYRKGISLIEITEMFPDNETAEKWFIEQRWPNGIACPKCGSMNVKTNAKHKSQPFRCREKECGFTRFSVRTGTAMAGSNLTYRQWAIACFIFSTNLKGVSSLKLRRDLNITQKSAWHLGHRLRKSFEANNAPLFKGPVEADETFIGGKKKYWPKEKQESLKGRGAVGKATVIGTRDRRTNKVIAKAIKKTDAPTVQGFVRERTVPGATVYTDEARAYQGMKEFKHETVNHSAGEYVREMAHTNGIESFWAMLKRGYQGTFHYFSEKHLDRYVSEFAGRHNIRPLDTIDIMGYIAKRMDGKRLNYADLIAESGQVRS